SEMSVIAARGLDHEVRCFPPGTNIHRDGILATTTVPATVPDAVRKVAIEYGEQLAASLDIVGLIALELFVTEDGRVLANEVDPRVGSASGKCRPWEDGCRRDQPVRAAGAGDLRPAAGRCRPCGSSRDGEFDRQQRRSVAGDCCRSARQAASLRQDGGPRWPQ